MSNETKEHSKKPLDGFDLNYLIKAAILALLVGRGGFGGVTLAQDGKGGSNDGADEVFQCKTNIEVIKTELRSVKENLALMARTQEEMRKVLVDVQVDVKSHFTRNPK